METVVFVYFLKKTSKLKCYLSELSFLIVKYLCDKATKGVLKLYKNVALTIFYNIKCFCYHIFYCSIIYCFYLKQRIKHFTVYKVLYDINIYLEY